jgi:hypothetical protein
MCKREKNETYYHIWPSSMCNRTWFTFSVSSSLRYKSSSFILRSLYVCVCVIGVIQYGARTSNCSLACSHLTSSHTKYDTSFVFSMFYQENENVCMWRNVKQKKNNKRKYVYMNSIITSICNEFTRALLHIHIHIYIYMGITSLAGCPNEFFNM